MRLTTASFLLLFSFLSFSQQIIKPGKWRGVIDYNNVEVPLSFEIGYPVNEVPEVTFTNGGERRVIRNTRIEGDTLYIPVEPFDIEIRVKIAAMAMEGVYQKFYRDFKLPFSAEYGKARFMKKSIRNSPPVQERWDITFSPASPSMSKGIGLFKQKGNQVYGTIMTQVSDYRYFEGIVDGDSIKLSCFDGVHAFLFLGKRGDEGWNGTMIFDNEYSESWVAVMDPEVELQDPFEMVEVEPGTERPYYDLLGAGQGKNAIDPSKYEGQVLIIQLFGTWCPNSQDQTQYLTKWYDKNKDRGVSILASSFEANYSQAYGLERLEKYREFNKIPYDLVLGGRLSKTGAAMPFSFMKRIEAFPTLVILDKAGYVRYVHSYFNGPATGDYYQTFDQRFNAIMDELLAE